MDNHKRAILKDPKEAPASELLERVLGGSYAAYEALQDELCKFDIEQEWQWYSPHKAWYAKGQYFWTTSRGTRKEKNLYWLHVFEGCFCVAVWFLEKNRAELLRADISDKTKRIILETKTFSSKLATFPVVVEVYDAELLSDIYKLINCKKNLEAQ